MWKKLITLAAGLACLAAPTRAQKTFTTPEDARDALIQAAKSGPEAIRTLMGPDSADILRTGDAIEDKNILAEFNQRCAEKVVLQRDDMNPHQVELEMGNDGWPFPIPLVEKNGTWHFDIKEGKAEIRRRIIGNNELDAIDVCQGYVDAQQRYAETDWKGDGVHQYAQRIVSTAGKKDGLYWPGPDSPVAEAFARAFSQGYTTNDKTKPFRGYYYKILLAQGPDAKDGAEEYLAHGYMIGGFALVAWPAEYRVSGIKTFIVNQDGIVFEKDLGPQTAALAKGMTKFNPDESWDVSPEDASDN
jgi:hypothetical protein